MKPSNPKYTPEQVGLKSNFNKTNMKYYYDNEFLEGTQTERWLGIPLRTLNFAYAWIYLSIAIFLLVIGWELQNIFALLLSAYLGVISTIMFWNSQAKRWVNKPTIDLISIAIVSEDNRELYLVSKEFNLREAWNRYDLKPDIDEGGMKKVYWIRDNVLRPIWEELSIRYMDDRRFPDDNSLFTYKSVKNLINMYGHTNAEITEKVKEFCLEVPRLQQYGKPELYGYYADYDHVALCWLFGKMIDLPEGFPMYTIDLKQMLDEKAKTFLPMEHLKRLKTYPKQTNSHHALEDAKYNQELHKFIQSL